MKQLLRNWNINLKIVLLFINSFLLFPYLNSERLLVPYSVFLIIWTILFAFIYYRITNWKALKLVLKLWLIGLVFFILFSFIFIINGWNISPSIHLTKLNTRIIYSLIYPVRVLAVFFTGLSFIEIVSPVEFLKYGKLGFHLCYLFRSFQVSKEQIIQNKKAMEMMGILPTEFKQFSDYKQFVKQSPLIIALTIRNMMIWLFWSSHMFERFKHRYKK